jgi:putative N6-adenine-specific DNA methylase
VAFRVTSKKSRLYHTDAIAERLARAIELRLGVPAPWAGEARAAADGDEADGGDVGDDGAPSGTRATEGAQLFVVRVARDDVTVSADSSGALLHRRGYRQAVAKAPLRETLAAALLLAADWRGDVPLLDPMCGSGTIAIEGALVARRIAPGLHREFAFTRWPIAGRSEWSEDLGRATERALGSSPVPIVASDRDAGAVAATRANAERAGVASDIESVVRPISALVAPDAPTGLVAVNPPYGMRIGELGPVRDLYAALGRTLRRECAGWRLALVSPDPRLDHQLGIALDERVRASNGGIPVRFLVGAL